ncbi:MAG: type IX secretion system membrane protein PorP/SprF [Bacteroidota bacterium]|nr:type IX secretion system membrane protein PorP/SprF [Bacteroidota bacterium]MDP4273770.1 type IX secretion system membrane protein PorP/SprF [Bacteroidota bacterium]
MKKLAGCILIFCLFGLRGFSQVMPVYSQYMLNGLAINPAFSGSSEALSTSLIYRKQWIGIDGAPESETFSAHSPLKNDKIALGLLIFNEKYGVTNNSSLYGNYAFRIKMGKGKLALGIKAGVDLYHTNWNEVDANEGGDLVFTQAPTRYVLPNVGTGTYYQDSKFYFGLSIPTLLSYRTKDYGKGFEAYHDFSNYMLMLTSGYLIGSGQDFKIRPSLLMRYYHKKAQIDLNNTFLLCRDHLWLGFSYRINEAMVALVQAKLSDQLTLGYSYDYTLGNINKFNNGSHEIMLRYEFGYKINAINPKFLSEK